MNFKNIYIIFNFFSYYNMMVLSSPFIGNSSNSKDFIYDEDKAFIVDVDNLNESINNLSEDGNIEIFDYEEVYYYYFYYIYIINIMYY